jgi:heme exporter protein D
VRASGEKCEWVWALMSVSVTLLVIYVSTSIKIRHAFARALEKKSKATGKEGSLCH